MSRLVQCLTAPESVHSMPDMEAGDAPWSFSDIPWQLGMRSSPGSFCANMPELGSFRSQGSGSQSSQSSQSDQSSFQTESSTSLVPGEMRESSGSESSLSILEPHESVKTSQMVALFSFPIASPDVSGDRAPLGHSARLPRTDFWKWAPLGMLFLVDVAWEGQTLLFTESVSAIPWAAESLLSTCLAAGLCFKSGGPKVRAREAAALALVGLGLALSKATSFRAGMLALSRFDGLMLAQLILPLAVFASAVCFTRGRGFFEVVAVGSLTAAFLVLQETTRRLVDAESFTTSSLALGYGTMSCGWVVVALLHLERMVRGSECSYGALILFVQMGCFASSLALLGMQWSDLDTTQIRLPALILEAAMQGLRTWLTVLVVKRFSAVCRFWVLVLATGALSALQLVVSVQISLASLAAVALFAFGGTSAALYAAGRESGLADDVELSASTVSTESSAHATLEKQSPSPLGLSQVLCVACFIVADAGVTLLMTKVTRVKPQLITQSLSVVGSLLSVFLGCGWSVTANGKAGLGRALDPRSAISSLPFCICFSLSQSMKPLALMGISPTLNNVIGNLYMALIALLSRFVFKRRYSVREWLALAMLTLAGLAMGLLSGEGEKEKASGPLFLLGLTCSFLCVAFSALGSLLTEKFFKRQGSAFCEQKANMELASQPANVAMLFVLGLLIKEQNFWSSGVGLFDAWQHPLVPVTVVAVQLQAWLGGLVAKRFSAVTRGIAQNISFIAVFFLDELVMNAQSFDWPTCVVALAVPFSVLAFVLANSEGAVKARAGKV